MYICVYVTLCRLFPSRSGPPQEAWEQRPQMLSLESVGSSSMGITAPNVWMTIEITSSPVALLDHGVSPVCDVPSS